jgi:hypothetical protein
VARTWTCADDARVARDRRRAAAAEVPPEATATPGAVRALRRSTSVTSASVFFLSVLHALHDNFRKLRSFVFVERISEVTEVFERERNFSEVSRAITSNAGVADVSATPTTAASGSSSSAR